MRSLLSVIYKHYSFVLKKEVLDSFLEYLQQSNVTFSLKKDAKERLILMFWKEQVDNAISLCLEAETNHYIVHQSIETTDSSLEEVIQNSISRFNVSTIATHRFSDSAMMYHYQDGVIYKVIEKTPLVEKTIYYFPSELIFERKMESIKKEVNLLLDKRNDRVYYQDIPNIDQQLKTLSEKMKKYQRN